LATLAHPFIYDAEPLERLILIALINLSITVIILTITILSASSDLINTGLQPATLPTLLIPLLTASHV